MSASRDVRTAVETAVAQTILDIAPLSGGCIGQVYRVKLADSQPVVVKFDDSSNPQLHIEGKMLRYLHEHSGLPVPLVRHSSERLLIMTWLPGDSRFSAKAQAHAAELLALLHNVTAESYGLPWDTLIGGLQQPNRPNARWLPFFAEQRLLYMAQQGIDYGRLPASYRGRLERFCGHLDKWLTEPARPSLIHGDVWTTNVLASGDRITGFVDPAIYYADPEIELAFTTLFGTFSDPFFERYQEIRPLAPGFFETRRDIYNLYPLLVHVRLFGGGYVESVDRVLRRFGY